MKLENWSIEYINDLVKMLTIGMYQNLRNIFHIHIPLWMLRNLSHTAKDVIINI